MNYLQKDNSAVLLKCWPVIDSSYITFCTATTARLNK